MDLSKVAALPGFRWGTGLTVKYVPDYKKDEVKAIQGAIGNVPGPAEGFSQGDYVVLAKDKNGNPFALDLTGDKPLIHPCERKHGNLSDKLIVLFRDLAKYFAQSKNRNVTGKAA